MTTNISLASPHRLSPRLPFPIVNFQYADDTVMIASARGHNLHLLMLAIHCFCSASGLKVNFEKSSFAPLSIDQHHIGPIEQLLQCKQCSLPITYLGMPLTVKKPTKMDFMPLIDKLEKRLQGWKASLISRAGRLQLVKSVLSSIPMYFMSCFKFPIWLIDRIDRIRRQFLWTRDVNGQAIHLINWKVACLPIRCGGLGIVNLHYRNVALLLRWWWRLYAQDNKLWADYASMIYAIRPVPDGPRILSSLGSFFWKSLLRLRPIFSSSARFQIVSGKRISFWFDNWHGQPLAILMPGLLPSRYISLYEAKNCAHMLLPQPCTLQHNQVILAITQLTLTHGMDKLVWNLEASGLFSVKSIYRVLSEGGKTKSDTLSIWRAAVTPSMRVFFYFFLNDRLLTHDVMQKRNLNYLPGCVMCDRQYPECVMHLFFSCPYASIIWSAMDVLIGYTVMTIADTPSSTYRGSIPMDRDRRRWWTTLFITAVWRLWRERNSRIFRHISTPAPTLAMLIWDEAKLFLRHCT